MVFESLFWPKLEILLKNDAEWQNSNKYILSVNIFCYGCQTLPAHPNTKKTRDRQKYFSSQSESRERSKNLPTQQGQLSPVSQSILSGPCTVKKIYSHRIKFPSKFLQNWGRVLATNEKDWKEIPIETQLRVDWLVKIETQFRVSFSSVFAHAFMMIIMIDSWLLELWKQPK